MDANISLRRPGEPLGTRCEIKNLNSFRFLEQALRHEAVRQRDVLESGGKIIQQTRLFDSASGETRAMRGKEDASDYRYFPDPDLPPLSGGRGMDCKNARRHARIAPRKTGAICGRIATAARRCGFADRGEGTRRLF